MNRWIPSAETVVHRQRRAVHHRARAAEVLRRRPCTGTHSPSASTSRPHSSPTMASALSTRGLVASDRASTATASTSRRATVLSPSRPAARFQHTVLEPLRTSGAGATFPVSASSFRPSVAVHAKSNTKVETVDRSLGREVYRPASYAPAACWARSSLYPPPPVSPSHGLPPSHACFTISHCFLHGISSTSSVPCHAGTWSSSWTPPSRWRR